MSRAFDRYVERGADALTDKELQRLDDEFQTAFENRCDEYRKGER